MSWCEEECCICGEYCCDCDEHSEDVAQVQRAIAPLILEEVKKVAYKAKRQEEANRRRNAELQDEIRWHKSARMRATAAINHGIEALDTAYWADRISQSEPEHIKHELDALKSAFKKAISEL